MTWYEKVFYILLVLLCCPIILPYKAGPVDMALIRLFKMGWNKVYFLIFEQEK